MNPKVDKAIHIILGSAFLLSIIAYLIFGKESDTQKKLDALQRIGLKVIGTPTQVGNYNYKRKNQFTPHTLLMQTYAYGGKNVDIYYNIPAPSGSNHAASPVTINGQTISW